MNSINQINKIDKAMFDELVINMDNTQQLYNYKMSWIKNYSRKLLKGEFNIDGGIIGMKYLLKDILTGYNKEFRTDLKIENNEKRGFQMGLLVKLLNEIQTEIKYNEVAKTEEQRKTILEFAQKSLNLLGKWD